MMPNSFCFLVQLTDSIICGGRVILGNHGYCFARRRRPPKDRSKNCVLMTTQIVSYGERILNQAIEIN